MLNLLTSRQQEVIEARYENGLTGSQTADRLRISPRRERAILAAARRRLANSGLKLQSFPRGRRAGLATPASQLFRNRTGEAMNLDTLHAA